MESITKSMLTLVLVFWLNPISAQQSFVRKDTIRAESENVTVYYTRIESNSIEKTIQNINNDDQIFDSTFNHFSRLVISRPSERSITLSTVPLEKIIILEKKGFIIGLSKIEASPYQIVIYNLKGELVSKSRINTHIVKLKHERIQEFKNHLPNLYNCLKINDIVIKKNEFYYYPISHCMLNNIGEKGVAEVLDDSEIVYTPYVKFKVLLTTPNGISFSRLHGFYHETDPLNELVLVMGVPYILVLNSEEDEPLYIPLVSNCKNPAE